jgi:hypothetical protein
LHALAERLSRIADGEPAEHVLFQKQMGRRRTKTTDHFPVALTFCEAWVKARPGKAREIEARKAVRALHPDCTLADSTLRRVCLEIGKAHGLLNPSRATPDEFEDHTKK